MNGLGGGARVLPVSLRIVPPEPIARALSEDEWPALRTAVNTVFRPEGGDLTHDYPLLFDPLLFDPGNRENLRVIVDTSPQTGPAADGRMGQPRVIAHAGFVTRKALVMRRPVQIACVGAVFTAPEHRRQGLGTRVLVDALRRARVGADLVMASGDRDLYRRQGLEPVPPLARFRVTAPKTTPTDLTVRDATADDLDAMAALHDAEEVHFVRSAAVWRAVWSAGLLVDAQATFSVMSRAGRIVAYAVAQRAGRRADGSVRPRRILELAGDRTALTDAAPTLADELLVPGYDSATIAACEHKGWVRTARQFLITAEALTAQILVIPWYGLDYL
jgi:predicted N-acetyltransferase YhbS